MFSGMKSSRDVKPLKNMYSILIICKFILKAIRKSKKNLNNSINNQFTWKLKTNLSQNNFYLLIYN